MEARVARALSAPGILRAAIEARILPDTAEVSRKGVAQWDDGVLSWVAWLSKSRTGRLLWHTNIGDAKFGDALEEYGRLSVPVRGIGDPAIDWPDAFTEDVMVWLRNGLGASLAFIEDRTDLCRALQEKGDLARGELYAWLPLANYPARLVQSLILARDIGSGELEKRALDLLSGGPVELPDGRELDVQSSAKRWAKEYAKALDIPVPF
jgi:hypothetical protein